MLYKMETKDGFISIDKSIVGRIAYEAVCKLKGKVFISNQKGKVFGWFARLSGSDPVNLMDISYGRQGLDIRIFIVIRFGISIGAVTDQIITEIKENVEELIGIEVNSVGVVVTGVLLKQVIRRNTKNKKVKQ